MRTDPARDARRARPAPPPTPKPQPDSDEPPPPSLAEVGQRLSALERSVVRLLAAAPPKWLAWSGWGILFGTALKVFLSK